MQNTSTISVYCLPAIGRFGSDRYSFRAGGALLATVSTRPALGSKLFWDTKKQDYSGDTVDVLCSKDGQTYDALDILKMAHRFQMKSKNDKKQAYLIQAVTYLASENV